MVSDWFTGDVCPVCEDAVENAHVRGPSIVVVPCGHEVQSLTVMELPDELARE